MLVIERVCLLISRFDYDNMNCISKQKGYISVSADDSQTWDETSEIVPDYWGIISIGVFFIHNID